MSTPYFVEFSFVDKTRTRAEVYDRSSEGPQIGRAAVYAAIETANQSYNGFLLVRAAERFFEVNLSNATTVAYGV